MNSRLSAGAADATVKPGRRKRWLRYLGYGALALLALALTAHVVWVQSGTGEWKLVKDEDGVKVWTQKSPGTSLLVVKGHVRVKAKVASMVYLIEEVSNCDDAYCYDAEVFERVPSTQGRYAAFMKFKFDIPGMKTRQYVLLQDRYQDPVSKITELNLYAAPNKLPRDPCCVRVPYLHNTWRYTPHENGDLDIELTQDTDDGGILYPLANVFMTEVTYQFLHDLPGLMKKDRYRNARVDGVLEAVTESAHVVDPLKTTAEPDA